jgi:hypothetical protein
LQVAKATEEVWAEAEAWVDAEARAEDEAWALLQHEDDEEEQTLKVVVQEETGDGMMMDAFTSMVSPAASDHPGYEGGGMV